MSSDDLFSVAEKQPPKKQESSKPATASQKQSPAPQSEQTKPRSNVPEMSVGDLANSLKRTLEETYGRIRVRGELTGLKLAASGHLYGDIKDVDANINIICWRGVMSKLSVRPEDGMDVIVTGRVSSYPKSSRYQIIIESMELAGEGALLKMLEERKKKLAAEGLFDPNRKKELPFLPKIIGVVTSPTGAVIQDILHRLRDRCPAHVLVWPVSVQGKGADGQIAAAIDGFNQGHPNMPKPDLLIVARGGGSLEDLMAFNEENVVRAISNSSIPVISAVGHETDTSLSDYAADLRAPTPTGAAELAVPVRLNLLAQVQDDYERLINAATRLKQHKQGALETASAKLGKPAHLLENKMQALDHLGDKLNNSLRSGLQVKSTHLMKQSARFPKPASLVNEKQQALSFVIRRLEPLAGQHVQRNQDKLNSAARMLSSLSYENVLKRGYALVYDSNGQIVRKSADLSDEKAITLEFAERDKVHLEVKKP